MESMELINKTSSPIFADFSKYIPGTEAVPIFHLKGISGPYTKYWNKVFNLFCVAYLCIKQWNLDLGITYKSEKLSERLKDKRDIGSYRETGVAV